MIVQDLTGNRYGRLVVVRRQGNIGKQKAWLCKCDCGNDHILTSNQLKSGTQSCGCLQKEKATEAAKKRLGSNIRKRYSIGEQNTRLRQCYKDMLHRCYKPNNKRYRNYGLRGIKVCDEWLSDFNSFRDWALSNGYSESLTLDRINVNQNYEPSNCRWASVKEQNNNKKTNVIVTYNGETMTLHELSEKYTDVSYKTLWARMNCGWNLQDALTTPVRRSVNGHYVTSIPTRPL